MTDKTVKIIRPILLLVLILFIYLQFHYFFKPGGTQELYGFFGSFEAFGRVSLGDPITAAGFVDLVTLMPLIGLVIVNGVPRGNGYGAKVAGLLVVLLVWPALALLIYLIFFWRRSGQFRPDGE